MAVDTVRKRASAGGWYWPGSAVDKMAAADEYGGIAVTSVVEPPSPVGVPELRRLTMGHSRSPDSIRRTERHSAIGRTGTRLSVHRR